MRKDWWIPLTGVAFVVVLISSFVVAGEPPGADEGAREVVAHYADDKDMIQLGALLSVIAAGLFVWFGAVLRDELRRAGGDGIAPAIVFAGSIITATGAAIDAMISFSAAEAAADDVDPAAVLSLQALWDNDFFPIALGIALFLLSAGVAIVQRGVLPKWLGWIAIVLGVIGFTPVGFVAFMAGAIWLLVVSVMLTMRNRRTPAPPPSAPVMPEDPQPVGVTR